MFRFVDFFFNRFIFIYLEINGWNLGVYLLNFGNVIWSLMMSFLKLLVLWGWWGCSMVFWEREGIMGFIGCDIRGFWDFGNFKIIRM